MPRHPRVTAGSESDMSELNVGTAVSRTQLMVDSVTCFVEMLSLIGDSKELPDFSMAVRGDMRPVPQDRH